MKMRIFLLTSLCIILVCRNGFADTTTPDPCGNSASMFAVVDRPSKADSACTIPYQKLMIEAGYQYLNLISGGNSQNFPQTAVRLGLPEDTELFILAPNYNIQSTSPTVGLGAASIGLKHVIGYNSKLIWTAETLFTAPTGSAAFGSDGIGVTVNGILTYNISSSFGATFMLGVTSLTLPQLSGGKRYTSVNPDLLLSWQISQRVAMFGEAFAQTETAPGQGSGADIDGGFQFLATKNILLDIEAGNRGYGQIGGFNNYVGCGFAILFG